MPPARYDPVDDTRRCTATNRAGDRCGRAAILGGTVCKNHGGGSPAVKAAAARRLAEQEAAASLRAVEIVPVDNPLEQLAELVSESVALQRHLVNLLADEDLVTSTMFGPQLHVLFRAYERAMERTGKLLADWTRLGFDERMVALHERQADLVDRFVSLVLDDLGLSDEQQETAAVAKVRHLHVLTEAA